MLHCTEEAATTTAVGTKLSTQHNSSHFSPAFLLLTFSSTGMHARPTVSFFAVGNQSLCFTSATSSSKKHYGTWKLPRKRRAALLVWTDRSSSCSSCPLHTNSGCGKGRRILNGAWWPAKAALVRNYLEVYWPCAGGLSVVNAIGTQMRDPINSGPTP